MSIGSRPMEEGMGYEPASHQQFKEPYAMSPKKINRKRISQSAGNLEGYHGVQPMRTASNKRLFGLSPCMRSCVDEVVFGRDLDFSSSGDKSAEMEQLLASYEGCAGAHRHAAALLIDSDKQPDADRPLCMRVAPKIEERGLKGHAGLSTNDRGSGTKRAWRRLPMQKSTVAEVVFGQDWHSQLNDKERGMIGQFEHTAGKSPRIRHGDLDVKPGMMPHDVKSMNFKRNYFHSPMNKSQIERVVSHSEPLKSTVEIDARTTSQFDRAAGRSDRFGQERISRKAHLVGPQDAKWAVYMPPLF